MSVNIMVCGADQSSDEYVSACKLKQIIQDSLPCSAIGEIVLFASATLMGQAVKDVDILMIGEVQNYYVNAEFYTEAGGLVKDRVAISSFCTTIEIKRHDVSGIFVNGTDFYVKYGERSHCVTNQSNKQKIAAMRFFERTLMVSPYIIISGEYTAVSEIVDELSYSCRLSKYKAQAICEVVIASMDSYRKNFARTTPRIVGERTTNDGKTKYQFNVAVNSYFQWVESGLRKIETETNEGRLYVINDSGKQAKEYSVILGILESMGILTFEMIGGANSQLYIYINQIQALKNILNAPYNYHNRLLEAVAERHLISVKMLTYHRHYSKI